MFRPLQAEKEAREQGLRAGTKKAKKDGVAGWDQGRLQARPEIVFLSPPSVRLLQAWRLLQARLGQGCLPRLLPQRLSPRLPDQSLCWFAPQLPP